ncbi:CHAT domain-containing protein [Russula earlei]|uniref:CHAT domain-containing protein n=1 Tax=Russula earlei TaxID=71964 RepID=A0ACC0UEM0_9AGAM|nr:CHAT domain-containing protein [Russula earlei]
MAYDHAMSLMQDSLTFAPTLDTQHSQLVTRRGFYGVLPLDYASYLIQLGELRQAIETLEKGRALLWSKLRGLHKVTALNGDFETLMLTVSKPSNGDGDDSIKGMDRIGLLLLQPRKLLDERETLISQARALPESEKFLKAPSFDTLSLATLRGPVVIINHSKWRSDIIILHHDSPPSLISTADYLYHRAIEFRDRFTTCRIERSRLKASLKVSNIDDGVKRYFCDLYIPSCTPTLSASVESQKLSKESSEKPSILLVAQSDQSLLSTLPEIWAINRLDTKVTTLMLSKATPSAVMGKLRDHWFLHFACHGKLEDGKPFDASFQLHNGKRLTMLELIQSQLPTAEFAFLSACHTAEMTEGSVADETLHLTAAMQHCGFRSVVGTMWGMADADGPDLVDRFYKSMFSAKQAGTAYYERSARALRMQCKTNEKELGPLGAMGELCSLW